MPTTYISRECLEERCRECTGVLVPGGRTPCSCTCHLPCGTCGHRCHCGQDCLDPKALGCLCKTCVHGNSSEETKVLPGPEIS